MGHSVCGLSSINLIISMLIAIKKKKTIIFPYIYQSIITRDKHTTESLASKLHTQQTVHLASCNTIKSITSKE